MTNPKEKNKPGVPTRTPQKKTNSGMFDNLRPLPHPIEEILGLGNSSHPIPSHPTPTQPDSTQAIPTQPNVPHPIPSHPIPQLSQTTGIAPTRDFNKRANSIDRDAMPKGHFPGTSYKLYNALYQRTRGAVVPIRTIQATKRELMDWSNIKSKNTIAVNLQILLANGWIKRSLEVGDHGGSIYEIFTPEEIFDPSHPNPSQIDPTQPVPTQKLGLDPSQQSGWDGSGKVIENKETSGVLNTSFKTNNEKFDDEAFAAHVTLLKQATKDITGKEPSAAEVERWREVAEVLVTELKIAAGRTSVSSVPAFLAEHLRRRLFKKDQKQLANEAAEASSVPPTQKGNASECPDCFGTGMYYPEGYDKGVARCRHVKLTQTAGEENQRPNGA
jgi:hypothetical protein